VGHEPATAAGLAPCPRRTTPRPSGYLLRRVQHHVSLETTNRYAEVDLEMKAKALETCAVDGSDPAPSPAPRWRTDRDLMSFLSSL